MKAVLITRRFSQSGWTIHWYDPCTGRTKGTAVAKCFESEDEAIAYAQSKGINPIHIYGDDYCR